MNSHEEDAIVFHNVSKTYRLYQNKWQMIRDVLGFKVKQKVQEYFALKNVSLTVKKGERIGLIGRNGAGKSTALKLITGNFSQTSGELFVNGKVQALMNTGVGFHPEFTGMENIKASLLYNGLKSDDFDRAVAEVVEFVELGEFIDQPLKTYSLGMQSRLYFAVATAIKPEILIVDEVLGAGDAYFSAKSADRMKKLTGNGCTLILVSHSTQQILQFCEKAIWLECGEIIMEGPVLEVVRAYEAFSKKLEMEGLAKIEAGGLQNVSIIQSKWLREKLLSEVLSQHNEVGNIFENTDTRNISRWTGHEKGLKINQVTLLNMNNQIVQRVNARDKLTIKIAIKAEEQGNYDVYFMILLFTEDGRWLSRHCSEKYHISLEAEEENSIELEFEELLLGNGKYIFSAGIYKILNLHDLSTARYYDLLSRSFEFQVQGLYTQDETIFYHPATWRSNICESQVFNLDTIE